MRLLGALLGVMICALGAGAAEAACVVAVPLDRQGNIGSPFYTGSVTLLGVQTSDAVRITGGCIDGVPIGQNTPAAGNFSTLTINGSAVAPPASTMLTNASNAAVPNARTNLGLGTTDNVAFGTGLFSNTHASITGTGITLEGLYFTGSTSPTTNLAGVQGYVYVNTPPTAPNNQVANFYLGGLFTGDANTHNNGVGTITLTATAAASATTLQVSSITGVRNGDAILVTLDSGTLFSTVVNGVPSGSNVQILPAIPTQATSGNNVYDYSGEVTGVIAAGQLKNGATKWFGAVGAEFSTTLEAGSSVFFKCTICASNNVTDVVQADGPWDMMYGASGQPGSVGAKTGIGFGPWSGIQPIQTTGTLIKTFGAGTVAGGLDISSYTYTGYAWKSPGATITGAGQIDSTNIVSSGVLRTTGVEASQIQMANGGQTWAINSQSAGGGGVWYVNDFTNSKIPLSVNPNATANVVIGSTVAVTGVLNAKTGVQNNGVLMVSQTAPTIASGGCTTGSAQSVSASNGTAAFQITLGGATCGSTITLTLPAATTNWVCDAHNITTPASNVLDMTGAASTTAVVLTNYVRTTGVAGNFTGAEKLAVKCSAY